MVELTERRSIATFDFGLIIVIGSHCFFSYWI